MINYTGTNVYHILGFLIVIFVVFYPPTTLQPSYPMKTATKSNLYPTLSPLKMTLDKYAPWLASED